MVENIILWLIIGAAAIFSGRTAYRTLTGRSKGCGSCGSCDACDPGAPPPQQTLPDLTGKKSEEEEGK